MGSDRIKQEREEAWIGDAVLLIYARMRVMRECGTINSQAEQQLTGNRFLNSFGEPTSTEAAIGRRFLAEGLDSALVWIKENLEPVYAMQEQRRVKASGGPKVAARKKSRQKR